MPCYDASTAFKIMNSWTHLQTRYETQFIGKDISRVDISFKGEQPRIAAVHYTSGLFVGTEYISLAKKGLLDSPNRFYFMQK